MKWSMCGVGSYNDTAVIARLHLQQREAKHISE